MNAVRRIIRGALVIFTLFGIGMIFGTSNSGGYFNTSKLERLSAQAEVLDDDLTLITETLYYNTKEINGVKQTYGYALEKNESIEIDSVSVNGVASKLAEVAENGQSGVYTFTDNKSEQELKIYQATEGRTTFEIKYRVRGFIKEYNDVQDFNWRINNGTGAMPLKLDATISFPAAAKQADLQVFAHGDVDGNVERVNGNSVQVNVDGVYSKTATDVRVLLRGNPVKNIAHHIAENKLNEFLTYEKSEAEKTNQAVAENAARKERTKLFYGVQVIFWLVTSGIIFWVLKLFSLRYDGTMRKSTLEYYREVPDYSPALSAMILDSTKSTNQNQLVATIFSLYTKKWIALSNLSDDVQIELLIQSGEKAAVGLTRDEGIVYKWLLSTFADGKGSYKELFDSGKQSHVAARLFEHYFIEFQEQVREDYQALAFEEHRGKTEKPPKHVRRIIRIILGSTIGIMVLQGVNNVRAEAYISIIFLLFIVLFEYGLLLLYKRTGYQLSVEGARITDEIQGLKNYLNDYSLLNDADPNAVHLWQKYFVYGLALGVSKKALKKLYESMPQIMRESAEWETIETMHHVHHTHHIVEQGEKAIKAVRSNTSTGSVSRSSGTSSSGSGGGFSGGGVAGSGGMSSDTF